MILRKCALSMLRMGRKEKNQQCADILRVVLGRRNDAVSSNTACPHRPRVAITKINSGIKGGEKL